jgi:PAS domain S-box-containing protein
LDKQPAIIRELREAEKQGDLEDVRNINCDKGGHDIQDTFHSPGQEDSMVTSLMHQTAAVPDYSHLEHSWKTIFDNRAVAITIVDAKDRIIGWNTYAKELFHMTEKDLRHREVSTLYPTEEWKKIKTHDIRQKGIHYQFETQMIRKDNESFNVELSLAALQDAQGQIIGSIGVIKDITELTETRKRLVDSEEKYRTIFDNSAVAIMVTDEEERITKWNQYTEELLGFHHFDLYLRPVSSLYPSMEWQRIRSEGIRQKGKQHHFETLMFRKEDDPLEVDLSLSVIKDDRGRITGSIGIIKDISERNEALKHLQESEENYRTIFENSAVAIMVTDEQERIVSWNGYAESLLSMKSQELRHKPVSSLYPPEEWQNIRAQDIRKKGMQHHLETKMIKGRGEVIDVDISLSVLRNYEGDIIGSIGIIRDITKRREKERELRQKTEEILEINQKLLQTQKELERLNHHLEDKVRERTQALDSTNEELIKEIKQRAFMQQELLENERKFHGLFSSMNEGVCLHQLLYDNQDIPRDYKIVDVNPAYEEIFGTPFNEIIGKTGSDLYGTGEVPYLKLYAEVVETGRATTFDAYFPRLDKHLTISVFSPEKDTFALLVSDISEKKKSEALLREREERFRSFFEGSPDYCYMISPSGEILDINQSAIDVLGYSREEVLGKQIIPAVYPSASHERARELVRKWNQEGKLRNEEIEIRTKADTIHPVLISVDDVRDAEGDLLYSILMQKDITELKKAEQHLRDSEETFRSIFEGANDAIFIHDIQTGKILNVNKKMCDMFDYNYDEVVDLTIEHFSAGYSSYMQQEALAWIQKAVEEPQIFEWHAKRKQGETFWVEVNLKKVTILGQDRIMAVVRDVTQRKKNEEKLQRRFKFEKTVSEISSRFLQVGDIRTIVADSLQTIGSLTKADRASLFIYLDGGERMTLQHQWCGEGVSSYQSLQQEVPANEFSWLQQSLQRGEHVHIKDVTVLPSSAESEKYFFQNNGIHSLIGLPFNVMRNIAGFIVLENLQDIEEWTEDDVAILRTYSELVGNALEHQRVSKELEDKNRKLEEQTKHLAHTNQDLLQARNQLTALNETLEQKVKERTTEVNTLLKQKDEFIHQLSHDLKNPLVPISNLLPLLDERVDKDDFNEYLSIISKNVNYIKQLVIDTLELARLNSSFITFAPVSLCLHEVVQEIIKANTLLFKEKGTKVINNVDTALIVYADKLRLEEIFNNLFSNAVKYMGTSAGTIIIETQQKHDLVRISVKDTGIGMTEEHISHVFEEFYKGETSRHDLQSSGLGLPICKRIVEKHGGTIWVESPGVGKGSTLYFTLPLRQETTVDNCNQ